VIERNPALPDHFLVLERHESFGEYARAYGDRLAEHYERHGVIVVPHVPIAFDRDFLDTLTFPPQWKKIGTINGIEQPLVVRQGQGFAFSETHPFARALGSIKAALYLQQQIFAFNAQLRHGMSVLFPRYLSLREGNITWRLTETREEGMHFDVFDAGAPLPPKGRSLHRLKIFINIDDLPREWRTSLDMPGVLKARRGRLPDELPDDMNVVADVIDKFGVLKDLPAHTLLYPAMSAVIANGETLAHEVVYGRRVVGGEFMCRKEDMLAPQRLSHDCLRAWLEAAGYAVAADAAAVAAKYAHLKGSYRRIQEERAAAADAA